MSKNIYGLYGFELPEPFLKTQRMIEKMTSAFDMSNKIGRDFSYIQNMTGMVAALQSYQAILNNVVPMDIAPKLSRSATCIQSVLAGIQIPETIDLIPTVEKILPIIDETRKIPVINWDWMSETLASCNNYVCDDVQEMWTDSLHEEINESVCYALTTDDSQKGIERCYGEWKERHPLLADVYLQIVALILGMLLNLIMNYFPATTTKNSNVYEAPSSNSGIVVNVQINQNITVINEVPYYYEVIYTAPETGDEIKGYIYKANVAIGEEGNLEEDNINPR